MSIKERNERLQLLQGTLDMLILQTLQWGPQHGLGISQVIGNKSEDLIKVEAGTLYPALHRLEQQGWVASEWKVSDKNQRAKYYRLTRAGKKQLIAEQSKWKQLLKAIRLVMRPSGKQEGA
ncbi:MAG TPA: PadR family transcriptional regulator [Terriglobia bacterium]|jgi:transcriptional regulator